MDLPPPLPIPPPENPPVKPLDQPKKTPSVTTPMDSGEPHTDTDQPQIDAQSDAKALSELDDIEDMMGGPQTDLDDIGDIQLDMLPQGSGDLEGVENLEGIEGDGQELPSMDDLPFQPDNGALDDSSLGIEGVERLSTPPLNTLGIEDMEPDPLGSKAMENVVEGAPSEGPPVDQPLPLEMEQDNALQLEQ